jgi:hypothetical protein
MAILRLLRQAARSSAEAPARDRDGISRTAYIGAAIVVLLFALLLFGV